MIPHSRAVVRSEKGGSYLWGWGDVVVDEQWARSAASFCNHSGKRPNCVILDDNPCGSERAAAPKLVYDYGFVVGTD